MKLKSATIGNATPRNRKYKLFDGGGLYLEVTPSGGKYWRFRYRFAGKQRELALGVYPGVSLKKARNAHQQARQQIANDIDPGQVRRVEKLTRKKVAAESFEAVSGEWFEERMQDKSDSHKSRTLRLLKKEIFPYMGRRPIAEIMAPELLATLRRIEARGVIDTAHRAKQTAGQVFAYAVQTGRAERNPASDLQGALSPRTTKHRAAITEPAKLGKLLRDMDASTGGHVTKTAMLLSPLLFQRPGEIRAMEWQEINWEDKRWELPAEKTKTRQPHIVPLPRQALTLLEELHPRTGRGRYVLPSVRGGSRCLSENGVRTALRDLGYSNETVTPHGFRATARTLLDEVLGFRVDYIEHQLAHAVRDANGRAYNRTSHLPARTEMMQTWADYLDGLREGAQVIPIARA